MPQVEESQPPVAAEVPSGLVTPRRPEQDPEAQSSGRSPWEVRGALARRPSWASNSCLKVFLLSLHPKLTPSIGLSSLHHPFLPLAPLAFSSPSLFFLFHHFLHSLKHFPEHLLCRECWAKP